MSTEIHTDDIQIGMTVATIPSIASGMTTIISGTVTDIERFELQGHQFASLTLEDTKGRVTITSLSGIYSHA